MATWDASKANAKYGEQIGAAERVAPGMQQAKNQLKNDFDKYDTILSKGSLIHASNGPKSGHLFPATYYTKSEEEKQWQLKQEATAQLAQTFQRASASNVVLNTEVPDKYVEWIEAKQKADFYIGFDKWIEEAFLDGDLAKRDFIKTVYPQYFEAREAQVKAKQTLDKQIFDLKLHGANDAESLRLEYLLRTGLITPDPTPIWDSSQGSDPGTGLARGYLSTHKWLLNNPYDMATTTANPWSPAGLRVTGAGHTGPPARQLGSVSIGAGSGFFGSNHSNFQ
jgi:hypothetical protein